MADIDSSLVTVGKPVEGGCCYTSFADEPTFPTDAVTAMSTLTDWESLGELSDQGYTEGSSVSSTDHKGWHGTTLLTSIDDETNTYKLEFVEVSRASVAKLRYGDESVTVDESTGIVTKIAKKAFDGTAHPLVIDELESNGYKRRTVVKRAVITSIDDTAHQRGSLMVYGLTFTANDPTDGTEPIVIYRAKPSTETAAA